MYIDSPRYGDLCTMRNCTGVLQERKNKSEVLCFEVLIQIIEIFLL